jgi:hypothetical protein
MKKQILIIYCLLIVGNLLSQVASVTITGPSIICAGDSAVYTAAPVNGGTLPSYQWQINGINIGADTNIIVANALATNDTIMCIMTSNLSGVLNSPDTSNYIGVTVFSWDTASVSYPANTYCTIGNDPMPTITGVSGGIFTISPSGLAIDGFFGQISLVSSLPNNYTVYYTTQGNCPDTAAFNINIVTALTANFSYPGSPFCDTSTNSLPNITAGSVAGIFSASPVGLVFVDSLTGEIDLQASQNGFYTIKNLVSTSGACSDSSTYTISIGIGVKDTVSISYSTNTYCNLGTTQAANISGVTGGTFSISPSINIHSGDGTIYLNGVAAGNYSVYYTTNGFCPTTDTFIISVINTPGSHFQYGSSIYCNAQTNPVPTISQGSIAGIFTASPAGLIFVDSLTGEIDLAASQPGNYSVKNLVAANGICQADSTTFSISIITSAQSSIFSYSTTQFCLSGGYPFISPQIQGLQGGIFSASPAGLIIDSLSGQIISSQSAIGTYIVTYTTTGACASSSTFTISAITINQLNPVFSYPDTCKGVAMSFLTPSFVDSSFNSNNFFFSCQAANSSNNYFFTNGLLWINNTDPGAYYITGNSLPQYCPSVTYTDTVTIYDCVWPGDANRDKEVGMNDLLTIGLYYADSGFPRDTINNT